MTVAEKAPKTASGGRKPPRGPRKLTAKDSPDPFDRGSPSKFRNIYDDVIRVPTFHHHFPINRNSNA